MSIELVIPIREVPLIGGMNVRRILPYRAKRSVGPFTFLDEMGPFEIAPGPQNDGDVPPHPHIGLATVTYLFEGEILHRDSLGTKQSIFPGDVNWMTAGKGIVHSERMPDHVRKNGGSLHGLQAWVALPTDVEEKDPSFVHHAQSDLPVFDVNGVECRLIAGEAFGRKSPVKTDSKLFYFAMHLPEEKKLSFNPEGQEAAVYLVKGEIKTDGQTFQAPAMLVFKPGEAIEIEAKQDSLAAVFGGESLGERKIYWNFVSSSQERIDAAKERWRKQEFSKVPGETEFVPLPE